MRATSYRKYDTSVSNSIMSDLSESLIALDLAENKLLDQLRLNALSLTNSGYYKKSISQSHSKFDSDKFELLAEIKLASPSEGDLFDLSSVNKLEFVENRIDQFRYADGLSILTEEKYFKGKTSDISENRHLHSKPILRKDFIIDEYQILEAKSIGADCILLIAAALEPDELKQLAKFAHALGLEVLMEP